MSELVECVNPSTLATGHSALLSSPQRWVSYPWTPEVTCISEPQQASARALRSLLPPTWTFHWLFYVLLPNIWPSAQSDTRVSASLQLSYSIWALDNHYFILVFLPCASHSNLWPLSNKFFSSKSIPRLTNPVPFSLFLIPHLVLVPQVSLS